MGRSARTRDQLLAALAQAGYTPGAGDLAALVDLLGDSVDPPAPLDLVLRALDRAAAAAAPVLLARLAQPEPSPHVVRALGRVARAGATAARAPLLALVGDVGAPVRLRREAVIALGKLGGDDARAALLARWDAGADLDPAERRALVEALGKLGGADAAARLATLDDGADAELRRRRQRAELMISRDDQRAQPSRVDLARPLPRPWPLVVRCRLGLEELLAEELRTLGVREVRAATGEVRVEAAPALLPAAQARLGLVTGLLVPLPMGDLPAAIAAALAAPATVAALRALTDGPLRWRLAFAGGGHRRGVVWQTAQAVRAAAPVLVNDPTESAWEVVVDPDAGRLLLTPKGWDDPRFGYRVGDVPAASHPTIAAALARLSQPRADDVVWDPFCGSGTELIERARLGPAARLVGTDLDPRALAIAAGNAAAAGPDVAARITWSEGDACVLAPDGVTCILSNPPLGRRIRGDAAALLARFVTHAATVLAPGGRLTWVSPAPERIGAAARAAGLHLEHSLLADLGGYQAALERWRR
ncbi:MAG: methyltransferase [Kofleriaceae bacterium]|nr:methyltransferase [Kofleriaceae bacterium]